MPFDSRAGLATLSGAGGRRAGASEDGASRSPAVARSRRYDHEEEMPFKRRHTEDGSEASECHSEDDFAGAASVADAASPGWDTDGHPRPPKIR